MGVNAILIIGILFCSAIAANPSPARVKRSESADAADKVVVRAAGAPGIKIRKSFSIIGKFYMLSEDPIPSFTAARTFCQNLHGDLASALSYEEFDLLVKHHLVPDDFRDEYIWVGAKRSGEDTTNTIKTDVYWITGEPLPPSYKKWWQPGGVNSYTEPDDHCCGVIHVNGNVREGDGPAMSTLPETDSRNIR